MFIGKLGQKVKVYYVSAQFVPNIFRRLKNKPTVINHIKYFKY